MKIGRPIATAGCAIIAFIGALVLMAHWQATTDIKVLTQAIADQIDAHSSRIANMLSTMQDADTNSIGDAIYHELQTGYTTSLILRSDVTVEQEPDDRFKCLIDTTRLDGVRHVILPAVSNSEVLADQVATNLICFRATGNATAPGPCLLIITTNTRFTEAVRLAGLWDYLSPATHIYLTSNDLGETMAQIKPVALRCATVTNPDWGEMEVTIVDSGSIFRNTIGHGDMCQLLQVIPPHVLQENRLFNSEIHKVKIIEGCEQPVPASR